MNINLFTSIYIPQMRKNTSINHNQQINTNLKADSISFTGSITPTDKMSAYAVKLLNESGLKENQKVYIEAESKYLPFLNILAQEAYKKGSGLVKINAVEPELEKLKQKYNISEEFEYKKEERQELINALKFTFDSGNDPYKKSGLKNNEIKSELEKIYPPIPQKIRNQLKLNPKEIFNALDIHKSEPVAIYGEREHLPYIVKLVDYLYSENNSKLVEVKFNDDYGTNLLKYGKEELLEEVPQSFINSRKEYFEKDTARLFLEGDNPNAMEGIDSKRIIKKKNSLQNACIKYSNLQSVHNPWLVYYAPTTMSCKDAYSEYENPVEALSHAYIDANKINRCGKLDAHIKDLNIRAQKMNKLNKMGYRTLHYISFNPVTKRPDGGTDFKITMAPESIYNAANLNMPKNGHNPIVNIPTEEVFTAPLASSAQGRIAATMPLSLNGKIIEGIVLTFKDGKVIDIHADKNEDMLKEYIKQNKNADRLGEVALVAGSPIAQIGKLFNSTLLDENAACHLALGNAYSDCVEGADDIDDYEEQEKFLTNMDINVSPTHTDFMVGGPHVCIFAENDKGDAVPVIKNDKFMLE